jgi:hypothetical protein
VAQASGAPLGVRPRTRGCRIAGTPRSRTRVLGGPRSYWRSSRSHRYSLLFALPLLVLYELLAASLSYASGGVRNGADVLIKSAFIAVAGPYGPLLFGAIVIAASIWLIRRDIRANGRDLKPRVFAGMAAEAFLLALVFGTVVGTLTAQLLAPFAITDGPLAGMGWATQLMVSLGAGIYEELLFRVILVSALAFIGQRLLKLRTVPAGVFAVVLGALIFSAFHYIGPYGDALELGSFMFRMIGGLVFSAMFLVRGFGITAWTHALYDVLLLVF